DALYLEGKPGADVLMEQIEQFEASAEGVKVKALVKKAYGKGGILNLLLTAKEAAPSVLPDVVIIDTSEIAQAAQAELLQPLNEFIGEDFWESLFPFAAEAGVWRGENVAIQFCADFEHLVYNTNKVVTPPLTWQQLLGGKEVYLFPARGVNGLANDTLIIQYLAAGGRFVDENELPVLDEQPLAEVLEFYRQGIEKGVISQLISEVGSTDECWQIYLAARVAMSNVRASRFLADRKILHNTSYAPLPTKKGQVSTLARGWAIAIVTQEHNRREASADFIKWLLAPDNNAQWAWAAGYLPVHREAFKEEQDPYIPFLRWQLESAQPVPNLLEFPAIAKAMQEALDNVLSGKATPEEAAKRAKQSLRW
ncbi:MAG TPA: extracellular solute-binding protein, partial [Chloroflexi bacterium]|nr:extracellular solute-binding protein [Chloroflexota bacterium]